MHSDIDTVADKNTFSVLKIHSVFTDSPSHLKTACCISAAMLKTRLESHLTSCVSNTSEMLLITNDGLFATL